MAVKVWGEEYRTTTVCVDSYENRILHGRFYNSYLPEGTSFHSTNHFLLEMEKTLNLMELPQSFTAVRSFATPPKLATGPPKPDVLIGRKATFSLRILFRQNASWQGTVSWMDTGQEQPFRSALELIFLINSALTEANEQAS